VLQLPLLLIGTRGSIPPDRLHEHARDVTGEPCGLARAAGPGRQLDEIRVLRVLCDRRRADARREIRSRVPAPRDLWSDPSEEAPRLDERRVGGREALARLLKA